MAKLKGRWGKDNRDRDCLILTKDKGWINQKEVYEWLEKNGRRGQSLVHMADCPEVPPEDLYEDGDTWILYQAEDVLHELALLAADNTGYTYKISVE